VELHRFNLSILGVVSGTFPDWTELTEVNFWRQQFRAFQIGKPFLFKLHTLMLYRWRQLL